MRAIAMRRPSERITVFLVMITQIFFGIKIKGCFDFKILRNYGFPDCQVFFFRNRDLPYLKGCLFRYCIP